MDLRQLQMFRAVVELGGVSSAARTLYVSPAAVSLQMKALGEELKTELFVRVGRRLVPTAAASRLLLHAGRVLEAVRDLEDEFHGGPHGDTRPFVFATGLTTLVYQLGRSIRMLRKELPANEVRVVVGTTEEILAGVDEGHFDLGLVSLPVAHPRIEAVPLFDEELLLVTPPGSKERGPVAKPADIERMPMLLYPPNSIMRQLIDRFLSTEGIHPRVAMELDNTEALKRLVEAGFGSSILPEHALRERGRRFHIMRVGQRPLTRTLALASKRGDRQRPVTRHAINLLVRLLAPAGRPGIVKTALPSQ